MTLLEQTNFQRETENILLFEKSFADVSYVVIPHPYPIENKNMIVMNYLSGVNVYQLNDDERNLFKDLLYDFILACLFDKNMFHSDLHIGNILFMRDGDTLKLGILDYGMILEFDHDTKKKVFQFFQLLIEKNYHDLFSFVVDYLSTTTKTDLSRETDRNKIIQDFMDCQKKHNILNESVKSTDIYFINMILQKYNRSLSLTFSRIFMAISSMYSLLFVLQHNGFNDSFQKAFERYVFKKTAHK
jgi:predicted unusual protein kinase regulating ubiquinone biosynthesis (AarF/ABC1/UbiB family)